MTGFVRGLTAYLATGNTKPRGRSRKSGKKAINSSLTLFIFESDPIYLYLVSDWHTLPALNLPAGNRLKLNCSYP